MNEAGVHIGDDFVVIPAREFAGGDDLMAPRRGASRHTDPTTSHDAGADVAPRTGTQRWRLLKAIAAAGDAGLTNEEAAELTGIALRSSGPRLAELKHGGWIAATGKTRLGSLNSEQDILVTTDKGQMAMADGQLFGVRK
jgi:hypothetical protein